MVNNGFIALGIGTSALPGLSTLSSSPSSTSQTQPLPNWVVAAFANSFLHASKPPKEVSIFCSNSAGGSPPPFGVRLRQKNVWFHVCAALLKVAVLSTLPAVAVMIFSRSEEHTSE